MDAVCFVLNVISLFIFAWIVLSWVVQLGRIPGGHPVRKISDAFDSVMRPILAPIRKMVPPIRMGGAALDLSPLIVIVAIIILSQILC